MLAFKNALRLFLERLELLFRDNPQGGSVSEKDIYVQETDKIRELVSSVPREFP